MNPQNYVMPHDDLLFKINLKLERWSQTVLNNFFPRFWANIYLRSIVITQCLLSVYLVNVAGYISASP